MTLFCWIFFINDYIWAAKFPSNLNIPPLNPIPHFCYTDNPTFTYPYPPVLYIIFLETSNQLLKKKTVTLPPRTKQKTKYVHNYYKLREINTYLPNNYILFNFRWRDFWWNLAICEAEFKRPGRLFLELPNCFFPLYPLLISNQNIIQIFWNYYTANRIRMKVIFDFVVILIDEKKKIILYFTLKKRSKKRFKHGHESFFLTNRKRSLFKSSLAEVNLFLSDLFSRKKLLCKR